MSGTLSKATRVGVVAVLVPGLVLLTASPVLAAELLTRSPGTGSPAPSGNDISYPQCGGSYPVGQAFGIVGLNDGRPNSLNPCLGQDPTTASYSTSELYWAVASSTGATTQPKASLYINTADPGNLYSGTPIPDWPTAGTTPYGSCTTTEVKTSTGTYALGANTPACAWQYGYNKASQDSSWLTSTADAIDAQAPPVAVTGAVSGYEWWLDVETANTWLSGTGGQAMNAADMEGMVYGLRQAGASATGEIGIYSTTTQWDEIAGGIPSPSSSLFGLPTWIPGAGSLSGAIANCGVASFNGGAVTLTQWVGTAYDEDYACATQPTGPGTGAPTVSSISPNSGPVAGGTTVYITGTGLYGATAVDFGSVLTTSYAVVSPTEIIATSPAEPAGAVNVTVTTSAGTSVSSGLDQFTYVEPTSPALTGYFPLAPSRICDTRPGNPSALSGAALSNCENKAPGPNGLLSVQVSGLGGVPAGASAVALDLVALDPSAAGYLTVFPTGQPRPTASNLNFAADSPPEANLVLVALPASGQISVYNFAGTTGVVIDVEGYVAPATAAGDGTAVTPVPTRICDTRVSEPTNPCTGAAPPTSGTLSIPVLGQGPVPSSGIAAVMVTITAIDPAAPGYLTAFPGATSMPTSSVVNYSAGVTVANSAIVPVGANGDIQIYASAGGPNITVDVDGYISAGPSGASPQLTPALAPSRICDTRAGNPSALSGLPLSQCEGKTLGAHSDITIEVSGLGGVPATASAVVVNLTVTGTTAASYLSAYAAQTSQPATSNLNWLAGMTTADLAIVPIGANGQITIYNNAGTSDVIVDVMGYVAS